MNLPTRLLRWFFRHLYTDWAWSYDLVAWLASSGHWRDWQRVALDPLPAGRLLELGHGPGHLLVELETGGRTVIGVDPSAQMGRQAARRLRSAGRRPRLVRARAASLPFRRGVFDGVVSTFPSEYIFDAALPGSLAGVLRPGGVFVVVPWAQICGQSPLDRLLSLAYRWLNPPGWQADLPLLAGLSRRFSIETETIACANARVVRLVAREPSP